MTPDLSLHATECIHQCRALALCTEDAGRITRTFLSKPMHDVHRSLRGFLDSPAMTVTVDAAGNFRASGHTGKPTLLIGSHLDTVPDGGAFDGILGVVVGAKLARLVQPRNFQIEVVGFSEEEGVRFGFPFIGSRALVGELDHQMLSRRDAQGTSVIEAIRAFGLDPLELPAALAPDPCLGFLEFHIEQGPVLESLALPLAVVDGIVGQTRLELTFHGQAGHAGTTPMHLRRDALAGAAEWIGEVERVASSTPHTVATIGKAEVHPNAPNVIPGAVLMTLDLRHPDDTIRCEAADRLTALAGDIAHRRNLQLRSDLRLNQAAVALDEPLSNTLAQAAERAGYRPHRMLSGAGHDAMVLASRMPAAMLFIRSPGGLSHHPDEEVLHEDVVAALATGLSFLAELEHKV